MWRRIKEIMAISERSSVGQPVLHTELKRGPDTNAFQKWVFSNARQSTHDWILSNFHSYISGGKSDRSIAFLNSESKKGFVIYLSDRPENALKPEFLMDSLKDQILGSNYQLYTSDVKTYSAGEHVDTQQRHYLKPILNYDSGQKLSQGFGNISIDYLERNGRPYLFKFSTTTYRDHLFNEAWSFEKLMKRLFE